MNKIILKTVVATIGGVFTAYALSGTIAEKFKLNCNNEIEVDVDDLDEEEIEE